MPYQKLFKTIVTKILETLSHILKRRRETIAVAETTTGGLICSKIVAIPGSSLYFSQGIVAYSKYSKIRTLNLDPAFLDQFGEVSRETAQALAIAVRTTSKTTHGLAETGIAGPLIGKSSKPLGTTYIALASPSGTHIANFRLCGNRRQIQEGIAKKALEFVIESLT